MFARLFAIWLDIRIRRLHCLESELPSCQWPSWSCPVVICPVGVAQLSVAQLSDTHAVGVAQFSVAQLSGHRNVYALLHR